MGKGKRKGKKKRKGKEKGREGEQRVLGNSDFI